MLTRAGLLKPDSASHLGIKIDLSATGNPIAAPSNTKATTRIMELLLISSAALTVQFTDGTTIFTGAMSFVAGSGLFLPCTGEPHFVCAAGNPFTLTIVGAGQVSGFIKYTQSDPAAPGV